MKRPASTPKYLADTHALIWHLTGNAKLSPKAKNCFELADHGAAIIYFSVITPIEIIYLSEKGKIPSFYWELFCRAIPSRPDDSYQLVNLTYDLALHLPKVPREIIPEMPDRIIAATASYLKLPLITKDSKIQDWDIIETIW